MVWGSVVVQKKPWWHLHVDGDVRMSVKWGNHTSRDKIIGLHVRLNRWVKWWAVKDKSFYFQFVKVGGKASVKCRHPGQLEMGRVSSTRVGVSHHLPGAPGSSHKLPLAALISFGLSFYTKNVESFSFSRTSTENLYVQTRRIFKIGKNNKWLLMMEWFEIRAGAVGNW